MGVECEKGLWEDDYKVMHDEVGRRVCLARPLLTFLVRLLDDGRKEGTDADRVVLSWRRTMWRAR